jgi:hypothetical protein
VPATVLGEAEAGAPFVALRLDPVRVKNIVGHSSVTVTLNTYADEFDNALHRNDLMARIAEAGFGAV